MQKMYALKLYTNIETQTISVLTSSINGTPNAHYHAEMTRVRDNPHVICFNFYLLNKYNVKVSSLKGRSRRLFFVARNKFYCKQTNSDNA